MSADAATRPTASETVRPSSPAPTGERSANAVSHAVLILWSVVVIVPMLWTLMSSFKTTKEILSSPFTLPATFSLENYSSAWSTAGIGSSFLNSVIVVGCSLVLVMVLGGVRGARRGVSRTAGLTGGIPGAERDSM